MAASIQNHCHLDVDNPPTDEHSVMHGSWDQTPHVGVVIERGVTGYPHVHRLVGGGGDPYLLKNDRFTLLGLTLAEMIFVRDNLLARTVYYVPNYHDPADHASSVVTVVLLIEPGGIQNIDPSCTLWNIQCRVEDVSTVP